MVLVFRYREQINSFYPDMTSFCFDFKKTIATSIYIDICVGGGYPAAADDHRRTADGLRFRERDADALQGLKNKKVSKTLAKFRNSLYLCSGLVVTGRCIWVVRSPRQHSITFIRKPPSRSRGKFKGILIGCLFCTRYYWLPWCSTEPSLSCVVWYLLSFLLFLYQ